MKHAATVTVGVAALMVAACNGRHIPVNRAPASSAVSRSDFHAAALFPDGFRIDLEIAANGETRQQGLMYRESLPPGRGMLFLFPTAGEHSFWMKNTLIPLDMIWLDSEGRIVGIRRDVPPCQADPCPSYGPGGVATRVLEIAAGEAARHGLEPGSTIRFEGLGSVRVE